MVDNFNYKKYLREDKLNKTFTPTKIRLNESKSKNFFQKVNPKHVDVVKQHLEPTIKKYEPEFEKALNIFANYGLNEESFTQVKSLFGGFIDDVQKSLKGLNKQKVKGGIKENDEIGGTMSQISNLPNNVLELLLYGVNNIVGSDEEELNEGLFTSLAGLLGIATLGASIATITISIIQLIEDSFKAFIYGDYESKNKVNNTTVFIAALILATITLPMQPVLAIYALISKKHKNVFDVMDDIGDSVKNKIGGREKEIEENFITQSQKNIIEIFKKKNLIENFFDLPHGFNYDDYSHSDEDDGIENDKSDEELDDWSDFVDVGLDRLDKLKGNHEMENKFYIFQQFLSLFSRNRGTLYNQEKDYEDYFMNILSQKGMD